jgi:hypothetical protein
MAQKFISLYMRLKIIFFFLPHGVILSILSWKKGVPSFYFLNQARESLKGSPYSSSRYFTMSSSVLFSSIVISLLF